MTKIDPSDRRKWRTRWQARNWRARNCGHAEISWELFMAKRGLEDCGEPATRRGGRRARNPSPAGSAPAAEREPVWAEQVVCRCGHGAVVHSAAHVDGDRHACRGDSYIGCNCTGFIAAETQPAPMTMAAEVSAVSIAPERAASITQEGARQRTPSASSVEERLIDHYLASTNWAAIPLERKRGAVELLLEAE